MRYKVYERMFYSKSKRSRKATIIPLKSGITIGQRDMLSKTEATAARLLRESEVTSAWRSSAMFSIAVDACDIF